MSEKTNLLPPIFFNHLYVVLDDKTYRAIQGSDFLQIAFPGKERRSTLTAVGETWSGTYFYCQDNYLEFFGSGNGPVTGKASRGGHWQSGAQEGWAGLAFSTDRPGGVAAVTRALQKAYQSEPFHELRQMRSGDQATNWFYQVKVAEPLRLGSFDSWVMEYHPDIFAFKNIPLPASGELTREAYLSPWNKDRLPMKESSTNPALSPDHEVPQGEPGSPAARNTISAARTPSRSSPRAAPLRTSSPALPVFSHVIGATLHLNQRLAERFAKTMIILGYTKSVLGDGLALSAHGFTLNILPEMSGPSGYRISALRLAMSRPSVAPMTFVFAPGSKLVLNEDLTADWVFGL